MKILITGATGLVGSELTLLLLQNGIVVNYLTTSEKKIIKEPNYHGFYWNPYNSIIDENAFLGVDVIVHLAGATIAKRWTSSYKQEIIDSRTLSANLIFKTLKNNPHQVQQFISASGVGIYPDSLTTVYKEETATIDDSFLGNVVTKWEASVNKFETLNIKVCKLRTGIVLSNKGGALLEMLKPSKVGLGSPFGTGNQFQSWIHLHDLTTLYWVAIQNQWEGVFNAVAPQAITNAVLTKNIATELQKPYFMPNIPKFIMKMILGEMHKMLFSSQNVSAKKIIDKGFVFKYPTIEIALKNLLRE